MMRRFPVTLRVRSLARRLRVIAGGSRYTTTRFSRYPHRSDSLPWRPPAPIYGFHAVTARLRQRPDSVRAIYLSATRHDARTRDLVARAEAARCPSTSPTTSGSRRWPDRSSTRASSRSSMPRSACLARRRARRPCGARAAARPRRRHRSAQSRRVPAQRRRVRRPRGRRPEGSRRGDQRDRREGGKRRCRHGSARHGHQPRAGAARLEVDGRLDPRAPTPAAKACSTPM